MQEHEIHPWPARVDQVARLFGMSNAFAQAADVLCQALLSGDYDADYYNTRVVLHLCRHATELFLKGAIQAKSGRRAPNTHRLDRLFQRYRQLYPEEHFVFDTPFGREVLDAEGGLFPETLQTLQERHDQRYRYPTDHDGQAFVELGSFDVVKYSKLISELRGEINLRAAAIELDFGDEFWASFRRSRSAG